ncbi:MAG: hypothetical protein JSV96_12440 [Candidatus Aminicenantes bacterium]|nr:MAG: hypothetical protein JSV96_12440 [Candidatus Aminicenantes bacterium]
MKALRLFFVALFSLCILTIYPNFLWSQLVLGQYEDEAPFRTWNTLGFTTAPSLAMGEVQFTLASDCSVALSNPALLTRLPAFTITFNSSYNLASFFKYSIVNTGVLLTDENISLGFYALDFGGLSLRVKDWTIAMSMALLECYDRPKSVGNYYSQDELVYSLNFDQEGILKNINFSIARRVFSGLTAGVGFNYVYGNLDKDIDEEWLNRDVSITDNKSNEFKGFYINGGLVWNYNDKLEVALIFRTPYVKKSESASLLKYNAPAADIRIEASASNEYKQPFVAGIGLGYEFSKVFRVASDLAFFNWSGYSVNYYDEDLKRDFKDVIKIGAGFEYVSLLNIFNQKIDVPLRIGINYDPQPMKEPDSSYFSFSYGMGVHVGHFFLDAGVSIGNEKGSGNSLIARKVALSVSFRL